MLIFKFGHESLGLPANSKILIGSNEESDVFVENPGIAPRHAEISSGPEGECWVRDFGSEHGTLVNGLRVKDRQKLEPGDELRFGPMKARFVRVQTPTADSSSSSAAASSPRDAAKSKADIQRPETARPKPSAETRPENRLSSSESSVAKSHPLSAIAKSVAPPELVASPATTTIEPHAEKLLAPTAEPSTTKSPAPLAQSADSLSSAPKETSSSSVNSSAAETESVPAKPTPPAAKPGAPPAPTKPAGPAGKSAVIPPKPNSASPMPGLPAAESSPLKTDTSSATKKAPPPPPAKAASPSAKSIPLAPVSGPAPAKSASATPSKSSADLEDEDSGPGAISSASRLASSLPLGNKRRPDYLLRLFILLALANTTLFVVCALWFYSKTKGDLAPLVELLANHTHPATLPGPAATPQAAANQSKTAAEIDDLKREIAALHILLDDTQKKVAEPGDAARQLADLSQAVDDMKANAAKRESSPAAGDSPISQNEMVLLKERNRLTAYADEAIATGARGPYERLWDAIEDPQLENLAHAARAEILRVQDCYINGQRVKFFGIQQHQIPVAEIFPDSPSLAPAQLSDDQLIQVLQDQKQMWQTRVKAAWQLGQRRNTKVGDALVRAIKSDPVLDVVAEATFSFEQITGYHAKLFDVAPLEAWWKSYNEKPPAQSIPFRAPSESSDSKPKAKAK
jgi:pSer/pThr/pTyr-binding forkhead associated (FHA) protein